ncbi:hypothetical protein [Aminobacter carboxidus]|uniref:Uncharacterized protein n=1 Tax=Aminobacter carboxidus TaxID=376165 RepID=A0ABR9GWP7_9HYPH|nr:hypothetical protein [Aminobacter carboxidus]MBE1208107.1 hypothetical protein [Aminobacter carboxidus]
MKPKEKAIRDAAEALRAAIVDGQASGLAVSWPPRRVADLASIEISETARALPGEPLNLTDEERAALPPLDPNASDDPENRIAVAGRGRRKP